MHEELIKRLRNAARWADKGLVITPSVCLEAADAIEELQKLLDGVSADNDSLCKTIDLYRELLGGHPDPRGEDGEPGIKCIGEDK